MLVRWCFSFLDYVEDLFQFFLGLNKQQLQDAAIELKEMTPYYMGSMLVDKESREEAIRKREERLRQRDNQEGKLLGHIQSVLPARTQ